MVSINYRLGAEGFLVIDETPPNRAVLDWLAATLLSIPKAQGLFSRVVPMSGAAQFSRTVDDGRELTQRVATTLGTEPTREALARVPPDKLVAAQRDEQGALAFGPLVDGDVIPVAPLAAVRAGAGSTIDLMIGTTAEEANATFLAAADRIDEERLLRRLRRMHLTDERIAGYRATTPDAPAWQVLAQATTDNTFRATVLGPEPPLRLVRETFSSA